MELIVLGIAGFCAGVVNAIAGGGTFLTFPALIWAGVPPVAANATSTVSVFPGYLGGAVGYRSELKSLTRKKLAQMAGVALAGGLVGSLLLLVSSNAVFSAIVPFLLFFATTAFLFGDAIKAWAQKRAGSSGLNEMAGLFMVCVYGGYFNGGLGIIMLALFALWGWRDIHLMNGVKSWLSFTISAISVTIFSIAGLIVWPMAVVMMVGAVLGGYSGARISKSISQGLVRAIITVIGYGMSAIFLFRVITG